MKHTLLLQSGSTKAHEVSLCYKRPVFGDMIPITSSQDIENVLRTYLGDRSLDVKEYMWLLCLNRANKLLSITELSIGNVFGTMVHIPEIFQICLLVHGTAFALAHNHPSGNVQPSQSDIRLTKKITSWGKMIDIRILDHLIITTESYYSFADNNLI